MFKALNLKKKIIRVFKLNNKSFLIDKTNIYIFTFQKSMIS